MTSGDYRVVGFRIGCRLHLCPRESQGERTRMKDLGRREVVECRCFSRISRSLVELALAASTRLISFRKRVDNGAHCDSEKCITGTRRRHNGALSALSRGDRRSGERIAYPTMISFNIVDFDSFGEGRGGKRVGAMRRLRPESAASRM